MRSQILIALIAAASLSACCTVANKPNDDARLEQALQHTWAASTNEVILDGKTTYLPGHVLNVFGHYRQDGKVHPLLASGTWHIQDGYLHYTIEASNVPTIIPNGFTSVDKIVRVTENKLITSDPAGGSTETARRIK